MYKITVTNQRCFMGNNGKQKTVRQHLGAESGGGENLHTRPLYQGNIFQK